MAKFYGSIGFATTVETSPGSWTENATEVPYIGDVIKRRRSINSKDSINPEINMVETISVIANEFILTNISLMRYVKWRGATWAINEITVEYPRVLLEIGGLYNGRPIIPS